MGAAAIWVLGAIGAAILAYVGGMLTNLVPPPRELVRFLGFRLARWRGQKEPLREAEQRFRVLIVDLRHDGDGRQTAHVEAALRSYPGLDIHPVGPILDWGFGGHREREAQARRLLEREQGDVLILGDVAKADERLRLSFLGSQEGAESRFGSYPLEKADLPIDFNEDFNAVLVALVLARVAPATEQAGTYLVDILRPVAEKLKLFCKHMPEGLDAEQRGSLWHSSALAAFILGEQSGESEWLEQAVTAYRAALQEQTRERVPLQWAMTQNNLGTALQSLGERATGTARLEEAVAAFRAALQEFTRERVPLQWAMTHNNLGNALAILGERETGTARLEEAVAAYRAALQEYTRERVPLQWATTQNNLGNALQRLGERETGTARLEEAVTAYGAALQERTRERVPLDWAMTQSNLGNALRVLGGRESGTARLEEAVTAYGAALQEWTRNRVPLDWAMTQNNLGNALYRFGERGTGTARLEEAVAAYEQALEVFREAGASFYIEATERELARAKTLLAERQSTESPSD